MSQRGSYQGIERTTTGFALIALAIDPSVHEEQIVEYPNAHH